MRKQFNLKQLLVAVAVMAIAMSSNVLNAQVAGTGIFFQAVARDSYSNPAKDRKIVVETSLVQSSANGTVVLREFFETTTDATGVFSVSIGQGTRLAGTASNLQGIDWSRGPFYLNLKIAIAPMVNPTNWDYTKDLIDLGTSPFGAVPFAMFAGSVSGMDAKLNVSDTSRMLLPYVKTQSFNSLSIGKLNVADSITKYVTPAQLNSKTFDQTPITNAIASKVNIADSITKYVTPTQLNSKTFDSTAIYNQLGLREILSNKSINVNTDGTSDAKYPSAKAVKTYVDASIVANTTPLTFTAPLSKSGFNVSLPQANGSVNGYLSSSDWTSFSNKIDASQKAAVNGVATLGNDGKIPSVQIPAISFQNVSVVNSSSAMTSISGAQVGSIAIRTDNNNNYVLSALPSSTLTNWIALATPIYVSTVNGFVGPNVVLTTNDVNEGSTNKYYTDARVRGAISATAPLTFNSATGAFGIPQASISADGFLSATDWSIFKNKQNALTAGTDYVTPAQITLSSLGAEAVANKSNDMIADSASTTKYPSVKSIKDYVDQQSANAGVADNSITTAKISGAISINKGGTGATTAAGARTNLGLVIGTDVMAATATTTLTGDVTGSGNGSFATTVNSVGGVSASTITTLPGLITSNTNAIAANTTSITANATAIAAEATTARAAEQALTTSVNANTASITANTSSIATNTANITSNTNAIAANTTSITANATAIAAEATTARAAEQALTTNVNANTASITSNTTAIAANTVSITANATAIATEATTARAAEQALTTSVNANTASITANTTSITSNTNAIAANTASITSNTSSIATLTTNVNANTVSITANATSIAAEATTARAAEQALTTSVNANTASITSNTSSIATLTTNVNANTVSITANATAISAEATTARAAEQALTTSVNANTASITSNTNSIAANTASITSNTSSIATLTTNVNANTVSITSNATAIATNTTNILLKAPIASPAFTGIPTAPTPLTSDNSTTVATTEYVKANLSTVSAGTLTGTTLASTITGSSLTSVGTITSGTWSASIIDIAHGGTATNTAAGALITLGAEASVNKSTATDLGNSNPSDVLFPSQKAVKLYVDAQAAAAGVADGSITNAKLAGSIAASKLIGTDISTVGTITTGVWSGTAIANDKLANSTITLGGTTLTLGGTVSAVTGLTSLSATNLSGTLSGTASAATALATGRTISTTGDITYTSGSFDGTTDVTGTATLTNTTVTAGSYGSSTAIPTFTVDSKGRLTAASTVGIIAGVNSLNYTTTTSYAAGGTISGTSLTLTAADGTNPGLISTGAQTIAGAKTFSADVTAPNFIGNLSGNATTATTAGNITATSNTTLTSLANLATVGTITSGVWSGTAIANDKLANSSFTLGSTNIALGATVNALAGLSTVTATNLVGNLTGNVTGNVTGALTGNASTATKLAATKNINGVAFDGSADVTIAADANTLTGTTLASNIVNSSLTTVGTITSGVWSGTAIANNKLANSSTTLGSTTMTLGGTVTSVTGLSSLTSTNLTGTLSGTATGLATGRTISTTGDITYTSGAFDGTANVTGTATLTNTAVTAGSYGSSTAIPTYTVDSKGRLTAAGTTSIIANAGTLTGTALNSTVTSSSLTGVGTITSGTWNGSTVGVAYGGTGVTTSTGSGSVVLSNSPTLVTPILGAATGTSLNMTGNLNAAAGTFSSTLSAGASTLSSASITGNTTVGGTMGVTGATTLTGTATISNTTASTSTSNGALVVKGGLGVGGALNVGGDMDINGITAGRGLGNIATNTAFGSSALNVNTTGKYNTAIGYNTLMSNLTTDQNTAVGYEALKNTTVANNTAVGAAVLSSNTTGTLNSALGNLAMYMNTTGSNNTAFGGMALRDNVSGSNNTALGHKAGTVATGSQNIFLGSNAGLSNTSVSNNILIGFGAGQYYGTLSNTNYTTGGGNVLIGTDVRPLADGQTNQIVIAGYTGSGTGQEGLGTNTTSIGNSATTDTRIFGKLSLPNTTASTSTTSGALIVSGGTGIAGNTNIGGTLGVTGATTLTGAATISNTTTSTSSTTGALVVRGGVGIAENLNVGGNAKITGTIEIDGGSPAAGKVLTSDASGLASWQNSGGTVVTMSATGTATSTARYIIFTGSTASQTITIPSAVTLGAGRELNVKNVASVSVAIASAGGYLIMDNTTLTNTGVNLGIEPSNNWIKLVSDGTNWYIFRGLF